MNLRNFFEIARRFNKVKVEHYSEGWAVFVFPPFVTYQEHTQEIKNILNDYGYQIGSISLNEEMGAVGIWLDEKNKEEKEETFNLVKELRKRKRKLEN